ncbi:hypothetical protein [Streptomyces sp. SDr-06]|uniref:hypothetical protein n=1 Tax=Streptomyces sp. SDr-06 TaxID=2267702 RepID=UPI0011C045C0|nr:hypothetical protein [Streptomyces sp. SDr-06]
MAGRSASAHSRVGHSSPYGALDHGRLDVSEVERSPLQPVRRLFTRAMVDGQESLAHGIPYLFGRAACPDCRTDFSVADQAVARWTP